MKKIKKSVLLFLMLATVILLSSCSPVDKLYGVESSEPSESKTLVKTEYNVSHPKIMSSDKIMPKFIDISVFDEENYSKIYLGKKFKFNAVIDDIEIEVPTTLKTLTKNGWKPILDSQYDENSMIYACESVDAVFENEKGCKVNAVFYNSTDSSLKLSKCKIVKIKVENNFYTSPEKFDSFNINGINNKMAITDVIDTLGTPSHFYSLSKDNYYLDYFVTEDDRRNGITVFINPDDDTVTAVEFSNYK